MPAYEALLQVRSTAAINAVLGSAPAPGTEMADIRDWLNAPPAPIGGPFPADDSSTGPDVVIGWYGYELLNSSGPTPPSFETIGQGIRQALGLQPWDGVLKGSAVLTDLLSNKFTSTIDAAATNPQAGPQIAQAINKDMASLPTLENTDDFAVAWLNQSVFAVDPTVVPTSNGTQTLGQTIKAVLEGPSPDVAVRSRQPIKAGKPSCD